MKGFKPKGACYANGGMVRGPGTGTSDSVHDKVPPGTFVMPADSTEKIGAEQLEGMGFKAGKRGMAKASAPMARLGFKAKAAAPEVPVNLSNGEFKLTPEQVHAIGAEVLEGMKDATHEAAEPREEGKGDGVARDALYFADGGLVEDERKKPRPLATSPSNTYPGNQAEAAGNIYAKSNADLADGARQVGGFMSRAFPGTVIGTQGAGQAVQDAYKQGGVGAAIGQGFRGAMVPAVGLADDVMGGVKRVIDPAAQALKTFVTGDATPIGREPAAAPGQSPATAAKPATPAAPATTGSNPNYSNEPNAPANTASAPPPSLPNNVTRTGNSYSGQNIGQGFTINGQDPRAGGYVAPGAVSGGMGGTDVLGILQRESQIRAGMGELQDRINFNGGGFGFRKVGTDEALRDMVVRGNSRDRATALGFIGGRQDAADRAGLAQQDLGLRQQDMQSRQGIAEGELGLKREVQGFQSSAARRQEALMSRYDAAKTPDERAQIAQQIRDLTGKQDNRFTVVPGGQEVDPTTNQLVTRPARVLNNQTGQFVDQPGSAAPRPAPAAGAVVGGYRFKGGNPSDKNSWEKA